jgi:hypothetical protein
MVDFSAQETSAVASSLKEEGERDIDMSGL